MIKFNVIFAQSSNAPFRPDFIFFCHRYICPTTNAVRSKVIIATKHCGFVHLGRLGIGCDRKNNRKVRNCHNASQNPPVGPNIWLTIYQIEIVLKFTIILVKMMVGWVYPVLLHPQNPLHRPSLEPSVYFKLTRNLAVKPYMQYSCLSFDS